MRRYVFLLIMISLIVANTAVAGIIPSMDDLPNLKTYQSKRTSSSDLNWQDGNGDARPIAPGQTLTLGELEGPGKITHIWFTIADNERSYGKKLRLRMYWDGERNPSVDAPLNDFFCQGHGVDVVVDSLPFRVTSNGKGRNCYFPMPFRKSAKLTVTNEGSDTCLALYYYLDWQKLSSLSEDTAYFHAKYRQEYPCESGKDYLILDAKGKGHFVGCNLSVRLHEPGWWGEGDDRFYIDGEEIPGIQGTGTEDYFCDGWGLRKLTGLYYGVTVMEGLDINDRTTAYRFHITDPVVFNESLKVTMEHKGARLMPDGNWNGYAERSDDFSSVAYWYQTEPHKVFYAMPSAEERLYSPKPVVIEGESLTSTAVASVPDKLIVQPLGGWSGGSQLFYMPTEDGASLTVKFTVPKAGKYCVDTVFTKSWDYGTYRSILDGKVTSGPFDLFSSDVMQNPPSRLSVLELTAGEHELKFECVGRNSESKGYFFGLDNIELIPTAK